MQYQLNNQKIIFKKNISENSYYAEFPYQENTLSLCLDKDSLINGKFYPAGNVDLPLYIGFNYFTVNSENLTILRYADSKFLMNEHYRPHFHYSVPMSLLNDPNGLVYDKKRGLYHLYYQYQGNYINGNECKTWGHCISTDLLQWKQLPNAIYPDQLGEAYSGSCVIDTDNSSGLFDETVSPESRIVALYTSFDGIERQCLAYSKDGGTSFEKYKHNPVIDNFENGKQKYTLGFRDPKVIKVKTKNYPNGIWLMVVAGEQARLFTSENLLDWTLNDEFVYPDGSKIISECPDFFPLHTQSGKEKWIFIGNDYNNGNSRIFYVIGDLQEKNGKFHFISETDGKNSLNLNPEAYASQTFYNDKENRRIMIAWLRDWVLFDGNMWKFEHTDQFSKYWLGTFTLPQELILTEIDSHYNLLLRPIKEIDLLRKKTTFSVTNKFINSISLPQSTLTEIEFCAKTKNFSSPFILKLLGNENEEIVISYNHVTNFFQLNKSKSLGASIPIYSFTTEYNDSFTFRILIDTSVLEIYLNNGEKTLSTQFYFQSTPKFNIEFNGLVEFLNVYELNKVI